MTRTFEDLFNPNCQKFAVIPRPFRCGLFESPDHAEQSTKRKTVRHPRPRSSQPVQHQSVITSFGVDYIKKSDIDELISKAVEERDRELHELWKSRFVEYLSEQFKRNTTTREKEDPLQEEEGAELPEQDVASIICY